MKKLLVLLTLLCVSLSSWAYSFSVGGIYYNITSSTSPYKVAVTYASTSYNSYSGSVTIPTTVTNAGITYSVTSIGSMAFTGCRGLTSVSIPSSITNIGSESFSDCTSLTSFSIPSAVTSIGINAFYGCNSLVSINIPSSVILISGGAFGSCSALITVDPANLYYSSLNGVLYNKKQTLLIQYPTSKTGSFTIPSTVTSIGEYSFEACTGLTSISIFSSLTSIGPYAFAGCKNLNSIYSFPATPIDLTSSTKVFSSVNTASCILYVPTNSSSLYKSANQWKDFINISPTLTTPTLPTVTTAVNYLSSSFVRIDGNVTNTGSPALETRGICWGTTANPTIANNNTSEGIGSGIFTSIITGLTKATTYHARAYATNGVGTAYGNDITFTTPSNDTQVYLNNIAFISLAQDASQTNVPATMTMNSNNLNNYVNPGNTIRFKMQCFNNRSSGANIVSGLCKVRCKDPYLVLTDSTSGLNNVAWNTSAWSTDEFEVQIKPETPWGHVSYVNFVVIEGANNYYTYEVPILMAPLSLQSKTVDDDSNPDSNGNGNGICEPGEIIESLPSIQNVSTLSANYVSGVFDNYYNVPNITVWNNKQGSSGTVVNNSYWNYTFNAPQPITAGAKDMLPQWDFVIDYNLTKVYRFSLGIALSGKFQLFSGYQSYFKWLVPVEYNTDYSSFNTVVDETFMGNADIYPNPSSGILNIKLDNYTPTNTVVNLYDLLGQRVYSQSINTPETQLNLSGYNFRGVYLLIMKNDKGEVSSERRIIFK